MKILLLFLLLPVIALTAASAQGYNWHRGDEFFYVIHSSEQSVENHLTDNRYIFRIKVIGKDHKQFHLACTLLFANMQASGQGGFHFRSDDINTLPGNTTFCLPMVAIINKPFEIWMDHRGRKFSLHGPDRLMAAASHVWALPNRVADPLQQGIVNRLTAILQPLFFTYPQQPLAAHKSWVSKDSTMTFRVKAITGERIVVTDAARNKDTSLKTPVTISGTYTLDKIGGYLLQATYVGRRYIQTGVGESKRLYRNTAIKLLDGRPNIKPFDLNRLRTRMYMGFWSDSLKTGVEYDSAKVHRFLAANDAAYGRDSAYIMNRLFLLQHSGDYKQFEKQLQKTPNWILRSSATNLYNKLQDVYGENPDSALSIIRYFNHSKLFSDWVHDSYAQSFITKKAMANNLNIDVHTLPEKGSRLQLFLDRKKKSDTLLSLLLQQKDTIYNLTLKPLKLWVLSQQRKDTSGLKQIAATFEKLDRRYLWYGRSARYGMLIYKQLKDAGIRQAADTLLSVIVKQLKQDQSDSLPPAALMQITGNRRLVNKNLLANAYYLVYKNTDDRQRALRYLGLAALYSPSNTKDIASASFYDHALLGSKKSYRSDFAKALMKEGNKKAALGVLTTALQANPLMIDQVRSMYDSLAADSTFPIFFMKALVSHWKTAKDFSLKDRQGKMVSLKDFHGRWLLLDFWGTWCSPCRQEMPKVQGFYNQILNGKLSGLSLLTVAAYDTPDKVSSFFKAHHYILPVAMANDSIIKNYAIPGYPAKVLISPEGRWLPIRFGTDWQDVVKKYMDLYRKYTDMNKQRQQLQAGKLN